MRLTTLTLAGAMICALATTASGQTVDLDLCVDGEVLNGENCGNSQSVSARIYNNCPVPIRVWICIERTNGREDCGLNSNLRPGDDTGNYVCEGTGETYYRACLTHEDC